MSLTIRRALALLLTLTFLGVVAVAVTLVFVSSSLPQLITVADYQPLLVSEVYDRSGEKIGEFYREKRLLVPYEKIPKVLTNAFVAAEDDSFFEHGGVNYLAILRSMMANIKAGRKVQGGSTITQQVARSLLLTREKTYIRKIKEVLLAYKMEKNLKKEEILYLYLNQIYLGQGAYGVGTASQVYFRKPAQDLTLAEAALLAGLPQAPSRYSPIRNPEAAKDRQRYVLRRMVDEGFVTEEEGQVAAESPLQVYVRPDYQEKAPFFLETLRQMLVAELGEEMVLDKGIRVYTGLDYPKQKEAQTQVEKGLRELDKRQGFRGSKGNIQDPQEVGEFLLKVRDHLVDEVSDVRVIQPDGSIQKPGPLNLTGKDDKGSTLPNVPLYCNVDQIVDAVVTRVDDEWGLVFVRFAEAQGVIDFETMTWARKPDPNVSAFTDAAKIKKPSDALKKGDLIEVRIVGSKFMSNRLNEQLREMKSEFLKSQAKIKNLKLRKEWERPQSLPEFDTFAAVELEQEPVAQGALISLDQDTEEVIAMVGGYEFTQSQFNRAIQAARQTGSSFKAIVYTSALDKGYTPATPIVDAPVVYEEEVESEGQTDEATVRRWKPDNHGSKFLGDILFRTALVKSLNVPTVKIVEKIGVDWVAKYARRLGIFSPLNMDFTLGLGSSSVTLYEMTKMFSQIGRLGKHIEPILIHKVEDGEGKVLLEHLTLDTRFKNELTPIQEDFETRRLAYLQYKKDHPEDGSEPQREGAAEATPAPFDFKKEPPLYFDDAGQLMRTETAYVTTTLLQATIEEKGGTGGAARALGRPVAGKTGTTNGYYDAWFVGFTPDIATGVWVGFDDEKSLGRGEVGGRAALPIWLEYMKYAHENKPVRSFRVPEKIVFVNIDSETGKIAAAASKEVVRQAFIEGTEPQQVSDKEESTPEEDKNFFKEDMSE